MSQSQSLDKNARPRVVLSMPPLSWISCTTRRGWAVAKHSWNCGRLHPACQECSGGHLARFPSERSHGLPIAIEVSRKQAGGRPKCRWHPDSRRSFIIKLRLQFSRVPARGVRIKPRFEQPGRVINVSYIVFAAGKTGAQFGEAPISLNPLDIDAGSFPSGASLSQAIDASGWQFFRRHFFPGSCSSGLGDSKSQA